MPIASGIYAAVGSVAAMPMRYHFVTEMVLTSSPASVERTLRDVTTWPGWWKWARQVDHINDVPSGTVGARYRNRVSTPMMYGFDYETEVVEVSTGRIKLDSTGDLEGTGLFLYEPTDDDGVHLRFAWLVRTPKWWMNLVGPIARPAFTWNHDHLMTEFARGLAEASGGELLTVTHTTLRPRDPHFFVLPAEA